MAQVLSNDEKRWQREEDAHTLVRYEEVVADPARFKAAKKELKNVEKRKSKELDAVKRAGSNTVTAKSLTAKSLAKKK